MADQWEQVVEDETLADPLIIPATGPLEDGESGVDEARAEEACAREDDLIAKDAERDLAAERGDRPRAGRSRRLRPPSGRRTTDG